jgi:hypothetical protein
LDGVAFITKHLFQIFLFINSYSPNKHKYRAIFFNFLTKFEKNNFPPSTPAKKGKIRQIFCSSYFKFVKIIPSKLSRQNYICPNRTEPFFILDGFYRGKQMAFKSSIFS